MQITITIPSDKNEPITGQVQDGDKVHLIGLASLGNAIDIALTIRKLSGIKHTKIKNCYDLRDVQDNGFTNTVADWQFRYLLSNGWKVAQVETIFFCSCGRDMHVIWHMTSKEQHELE